MAAREWDVPKPAHRWQQNRQKFLWDRLQTDARVRIAHIDNRMLRKLRPHYPLASPCPHRPQVGPASLARTARTLPHGSQVRNEIYLIGVPIFSFIKHAPLLREELSHSTKHLHRSPQKTAHHAHTVGVHTTQYTHQRLFTDFTPCQHKIHTFYCTSQNRRRPATEEHIPASEIVK